MSQHQNVACSRLCLVKKKTCTNCILLMRFDYKYANNLFNHIISEQLKMKKQYHTIYIPFGVKEQENLEINYYFKLFKNLKTRLWLYRLSFANVLQEKKRKQQQQKNIVLHRRVQRSFSLLHLDVLINEYMIISFMSKDFCTIFIMYLPCLDYL